MLSQNVRMLLIFALLFACLGGCGSAGLSRSRAISLIAKDDAFKSDAITVDLKIGAGILDVGPVERDMERAGLIKIVARKCRPYNIAFAHGSADSCGELSFTKVGTEVSQKWTGTPWDNGKGMDYEVPVASRIVKEIRSTKEESGMETAAEFSWGCQPNDLAAQFQLDITPPVFMASGARCPESIAGSKTSSALFKRTADGWRLDRIRWQD